MISERLRHARDFCGLTQEAVADLSGVAQGRISDIELGRIAAKPEEVERLARALSFPVSFFNAGPLPDLPEGNFRRLKRGRMRASVQVRAQARQIIELVMDAEQEVEFPPVRLSPVSAVADMDAIEMLAEHVREQAGVGLLDPIPNVTRAVERAGVVVAGLPGEIPDHFGYSAWPNFRVGGRPVILFSRSDPGDRQRFTIAHELGHLLLHTPVRDEELTADEAEREANRFAGALLLPEKAAREAMKAPLTLTTLAHIKARFGASIGLCAYRAKDLGLITDARHTSLRKQMSSRGWHRSEPVPVEQEAPLLIRKVLDRVVTGDSVSKQAESLKLPTFAYRALTASN